MLRLVLTNLISNTLKFTQPRQQAQIEIGSLPGQDAETVIFVRDNGVGSDMAYADKLFGVFQRLHRAEEFEGTGIGIANVRRIIALHGDRIWVEGENNQGPCSTFHSPQQSEKMNKTTFAEEEPYEWQNHCKNTYCTGYHRSAYSKPRHCADEGSEQ